MDTSVNFDLYWCLCLTLRANVREGPINSLTLELDIHSSAHRLCKTSIFYEPRRLTLGNTRHFVEE